MIERFMVRYNRFAAIYYHAKEIYDQAKQLFGANLPEFRMKILNLWEAEQLGATVPEGIHLHQIQAPKQQVSRQDEEVMDVDDVQKQLNTFNEQYREIAQVFLASIRFSYFVIRFRLCLFTS